MEEQRRYTRFPCQGGATLSQGNQSMPVELVDLSLDGVLLRLPLCEPLEPAGSYQLIFQLPQSNQAVTMQLVITHQSESVIGARCQQLSREDRDRLCHYIAFHAADDGLLQRELTELLEQHQG